MLFRSKQAIEGVFNRLAQVSNQGAPRDPEAEAYITQNMSQTAGSAYYLAQTVLVQDSALQSAQTRIQQLEDQLRHQAAPAQSGGFMSRLFGGGNAPAPHQPAPRSATHAEPSSIPKVGRSSPFGGGAAGQHAPQGGGFLAGAAQTAVGVAGGMMLGNMLGSMFAGGANAAPAPEEAPAEEPQDETEEFDAGVEDDSEW